MDPQMRFSRSAILNDMEILRLDSLTFCVDRPAEKRNETGGADSAIQMPTEDDVAIVGVTERLRNKLMQGYSKERRPAADHKKPFALAVTMSLTQFDLVFIFDTFNDQFV